jgi:S1-C subfamily serine protease
VGDLIHSVDGDRVREGAELQQVLVKREVGDTVKLGIVRGETEIEIGVELVKREELFKMR